MIRAAAIIALALACASAAAQQPAWVAHNVDPSTITFRPVDGGMQVEAVVLYADNKVAGRIRTAVTGCHQGVGTVFQVTENGDALGDRHIWSLTGTAWRDSLARSICLVAAHANTKPRASREGWT